MAGSRLEDQDLDADADEALEAARAMPPGPEKTEALKKAGLLRVAADARKIAFARRGRPPKLNWQPPATLVVSSPPGTGRSGNERLERKDGPPDERD